MLRLLEKIVLVDIVIFGISLLAWFFFFERTVKSLSNTLVVLGAITIAIGTSFLFGEKAVLGDLEFQWGRSVSSARPEERKRQDVEDLKQSYKQSTPFFIAGLIGIVIGILFYGLLG